MAIKDAISCSKCIGPIYQCPINKMSIMVTGCFHSFCVKCAKDWVKEIEKPCPLCRASIYQTRSGKDFVVIWNVFLRIIKKEPAEAGKVLATLSESEDSCSMCLDDFPEMGLYFNPQTQQFFHGDCKEEECRAITLKDVIHVVQAWAQKDASLQSKVVPAKPTLWERGWYYMSSTYRKWF